MDAEFEPVGEQRRTDRRRADRRAQRQRFDPLFMATLINHVTPPEAARARYAPQATVRTGLLVNIRS